MKKYPIYKKVVREKITCICLRSNKQCERICEKDTMLYDEFKAWRECFKNKKEQWVGGYLFS